MNQTTAKNQEDSNCEDLTKTEINQGEYSLRGTNEDWGIVAVV